nr:glutamate racemase [Swingsia samuiensis]
MPAPSSFRCLVFDSGIGGMGVVQTLRNSYPHLQLDYLADTAFFPYGEQADEVLAPRIIDLLSQACEALSPNALVIACNTASTIALPALREKLSVPVIGCVPPIRWAGRVSQSRTIGLLATSATARRPYVLNLHREFASDCHLIIHGARKLADLAERAFLGDPIDDVEIQAELDSLFHHPHGQEIDTIGLGCTHYTFLLPALQKLAKPSITWLDPAPAVARQLQTVLEGLPVSTQQPIRPATVFTTSQPTDINKLKLAMQKLKFEHWEIFKTAP